MKVDMPSAKFFRGACRAHAAFLSCFLIAGGCLGFGSAVAEERKGDSVQEGAKSIENGFGELLKGMGQEVGKIIGSKDEPEKKQEKQESKPAGKESK